MTEQFFPDCRNSLIGSLPGDDHGAAGRLVREYSPDIPLWIQLPANTAEDMILQFLPGMPGLAHGDKGAYIDTENEAFDTALVDFYEEYLAVTDGSADIDDSIFALTPEYAPGFSVLLQALENQVGENQAGENQDGKISNGKIRTGPPAAVKGQVTGPVTLCTSVTDQEKTAIFYNDQLRDAAVKLISMKAAWQVRQLSRFNAPVIIFIDEPSLAGFGSSEFTSISRDQVGDCLREVINAVHAEGGLAGIHVCANTDWSVILDASADIVNFDAYSYFDRFVLYPEQIKAFLSAGGILAWGIVPTFPVSRIEKETVGSLVKKLKDQMKAIRDLGVDGPDVFARSLITPSCGAGSLGAVHAAKVLELTHAVSGELRREGYGFLDS
jgi:methionine synthase II (cobalamin-independent)